MIAVKNQYDLGSGRILMGSLVAPQATVALNAGSINGYIWVKNLYQLNVSDIHNFYNPFLTSLGEFKLVKRDLATNTPLQDVEFSLKRQDGKEMLDKDNKTDTNGEIDISGLIAGTYTLREVAPLPRYIKNEITWRIVVATDGSHKVYQNNNNGEPEVEITTPQIEIYNQKYLTATFGKIDSNTNVKLEGATFAVQELNKDGTPSTSSDVKPAITLNKDTGQYELTNLRPNYLYKITEETAPDGYEKLDPEKDYWIVTINSAGEVTIKGFGKADNLFVNKNPETKEPTDQDTTAEDSETKETDFDLKNDQTPIPLPQTGGHGTLNYWIVGIILLIFGGIAISIRLRDRRWSKWTS